MSGSAVMIEIRFLPIFISRALQGALEALPKTWEVHFWHGETNALHIPNVVRTPLNATFPREYGLGLLSQKKQGWWETRRWFNAIITNRRFWASFQTRHLLLFQLDTAFCSRPSAHIDLFLKYDYVGAPWTSTKAQCTTLRGKLRIGVIQSQIHTEHYTPVP